MDWPVCPAFPLVFSGWALLGLGGQVVAGVGGPHAAVNSASRAACQGQSLGRCTASRRAERASLAGMVIRCRRMVAVVALAWNTDAVAPLPPCQAVLRHPGAPGNP